MAPARAAGVALLLALLCGARAQQPTVLPGADAVDAAAIPKSFDAREEFYGCAVNILNQAHCGSCWAVSAAGTLADRYCVHAHRQFGSAGATPLALSPQPLVSCASAALAPPDAGAAAYQSEGCNGGFQEEAWRFLTATGTAQMSADQTAGCRPYWSSFCSPDPSGDGCLPCAAVAECIDTGEIPERFGVAAAGAVVGSEHDMDAQVAAVQREIMENGPVQACFDVYANFFEFFDDYPMGTYNNTEGAPTVGGHCVKVIGWGETHAESMPYWLIANSWGEGWAQRGLFRYIRGANLGGMDTAVWAGCPNGTRCSLTPAVVPPEQAPPAARGTGGRWHTAATAAPHAHITRSFAALVSHLESGAPDAAAGGELLAALRSGAVEGGDALLCAQTQVIAGLRARLVLRAGPPGARRHVVATTRQLARRAARGATPAHEVESLRAVDAAEASALCFGAADEALTRQMKTAGAFQATLETAAVDF